MSAELLVISKDPAEVDDLGHSKEQIEQIYAQAVKVKPVASALERYVDRLEQKQRIHEVSARVAMEIARLEGQQEVIKGSANENQELLLEIKKGIVENTEMIKSNLAYLRAKGLNKEVLEKAKKVF